ncbi:uncharacterized protein LOC119337350 [Triticum dicoccoides]|uniref:uncharacterized protein LOC119337350 n=1 Tax=Triticum dicoccoides TaxID=85692 RepID=UPI00189124A3|nr:uncharacterized protein LOC119337350 [Triticum dicoccoides]
MKSSPPPPPMPAASGASGAARHAPSCRRSAPPSPPPRLSAPGLYSPLATTHPWLGFRAWLRRRVSGGPSWGTPWEFPIHHGRRCQGILQGDVKDAMDMQLLKRRIGPRIIFSRIGYSVHYSGSQESSSYVVQEAPMII